MNSDKIKILKLIDESKDAINNSHIGKRYPEIDLLQETKDLMNDGFIEKHPVQFGYQLTTAGRNALDAAKRSRYETIRYSITTAIAVAAFIKSFFS